MKTAMKKIFSLMLVAVLLVGVMPFQAFAAEPVHVWLELEPGRYTINDDFIDEHYTGSGTPTKYYVHNKGYMGDSFELGETTAVLLVIEEFAPVAQPDVCGNCGGSHKTEACDKVQCTVCNAWTDHDASAHCGYKGCTARDHAAADHCTTCDALKSACPVTCPGNPAYVEPTPDPATVEIIVNNAGTGKSFTVEAGKGVNDVYAAFKASDLFNDETGPILTLADSDKPVAATESGKTYWLWLSLDNTSDVKPEDPADPDEPEVTPDKCAKCEGALTEFGDCAACLLDQISCTCGQTTQPEDTRGKVKVYLNLNYAGAYKFGEHMQYVWAERNALLKDVIATVPAPNRDKHTFRYWTTDASGSDIIDTHNYDARATADGVVIYAQWADDVQSTTGKIMLRINLNYDHKMGETIKNIVFGAKVGNVLEHVAKPYRWNYKFVGWYWDKECKDPVEYDDRLYMHDEVFAKWERRYTNNEVMLKIYLNGNTTSVFQVLDVYSLSLDDGEISLNEVKEVVKKYYTSRNSDGMYFEGLYDSKTWSNYVRHPRFARGAKDIDVNLFGDTVVYVMVNNAKIRTNTNSSSSSATADSSNPKTGDMIMTPVIVLGASAACLATLFYLNKKRAY